MYAERAAARLRRRGKSLRRLAVTQRRRLVQFNQCGDVRSVDIAENQDRQGQPGLAQLRRLLCGCDREEIRALPLEYRRHRHRAVSVGIRLDYAEHLCLRLNRMDMVADIAKILREPTQVDLRPCPVFILKFHGIHPLLYSI